MSASFGTVNATGMNVTGILQANQVITTQPMSTSNLTVSNVLSVKTLGVSGAASLANVTASGLVSTATLGVSGATTLANVTASGSVSAASGTITKNLNVAGALVNKNDFMYVNATCPLPSMLLQDPNKSTLFSMAYFDKDTKILYQTVEMSRDLIKKSELNYVGNQLFFNNKSSIQFVDFTLVDVCSSNGASIRSVSAGYDMRSLVNGEQVRWRANLQPITQAYLGGSAFVQYAYWRMNMAGVYLDLIHVQNSIETVYNLYWFPFINGDIKSTLPGTTVQLNATTNVATVNAISNFTDFNSPTLAYKLLAEYMFVENRGLNDSYVRPLYSGHGASVCVSDFEELYDAMIKDDIWNTKYTNQEIFMGPKFDNVDTSNNFNLWNYGARYSTANWNAYYRQTFINFLTATKVGVVADSNIYYPGPMQYSGLDNYLKIQIPTNNNCYGVSNVSNATSFIDSYGTSIMPIRPIMKVREGMSYYDWCECVTHMWQQDNVDGHTAFNLYTSAALNTTPYSAAIMPLDGTGIIGSIFIANNGKMNVPYTFPSFFAKKSTLTARSVPKHLYTTRNVVNHNRVGGRNIAISTATVQANVYSLIGKCAYYPDIKTSFVSNVMTGGFHYTEPVMYTDYVFGVVSNALSSNNWGALLQSFTSASVNDSLTDITQQGVHNVLLNSTLPNVSNTYKNSVEYVLRTSALGLSGSRNTSNVVVPYSANISMVNTHYYANASILQTGVQFDVLPTIPANAPNDFGSQYFGYYARHLNGNAWSSTDWYTGMTSNLASYSATLADTSFVATDFYGTIATFSFGQVDTDLMRTKTNSNVNVTSNVGWISSSSYLGPSGMPGWLSTSGSPPAADGFYRSNPVVYMANYGFNLDTQVMNGMFYMQALAGCIYLSDASAPGQMGGPNPVDLYPIFTAGMYDYVHNTLKCDTIVYDMRSFNGGGPGVGWSSSVNYANLATSNTWLDIGLTYRNNDRLSVGNQKWSPSDIHYGDRILGQNVQTYRPNALRMFFQNDKYPTTTLWNQNDNVKIIKLGDGRTASGGEFEFSSEGFLTAGQIGNAKIINLCRNTSGATGAYSVNPNPPTTGSNLIANQRTTASGIVASIKVVGGITFANQGYIGLDPVVLGANAIPGINQTYPGTYGNPAADVAAGYRTGWQDAGIDVSDVAGAKTFFSKGPEYILPVSGNNLSAIKNQPWRDCDLEKTLLIADNVSYANFSNIAYYQANKSLFTYQKY